MTEIAYIILGTIFAFIAWDCVRRWMLVSQARLGANERYQEVVRSCATLETRCKVFEQQLKQTEQLLAATRSGMDECIVRLDTIKMQNWPTREQVRELEDHTRKELHGFDDEMRKFWARLETMDMALKTTAGQVIDLTAKATALQSMRGQVRPIAP